MTKKLLTMMSIAMLMASCSNDEMESVVSNGDETQVTFTVALNSAPGTRAISDGMTVDELYYEVYDKDGNKLEISGMKTPAFQNSREETVKITLAKGQTYTFGFWAQKEGAYQAGDLKRIELNYADVAGNNEERDAFFAYTEPITVTGDFSHSVTLKRPFAQLNLAVSDLDAFQKAGVKLNQVEVTVSEAAGNFDVTTGKVSGAVSAKFNLADVLCNGTENPTLKLLNPININGTDKSEFPWVSMNYLLVNDETTGAASSNVDVTFTIKTTGDDVVLTSTGTPVQRNYRTNLIASLTNTGTFNIVIDPLYDGENNIYDGETKIYPIKAGDKYYETIAEALAAGETDIQLSANEKEYELNSTNLKAADITITGTDKENTKVKILGQIRGVDGETSLTLKNVTVDVPTGLYYGEHTFGFAHYLKNFTMVDCKSTGRILLNVHNALIDNCEFNVDVTSGFDGYAIFYYGADKSTVTVSNSTFNTAGKAIVLYNESNPELNLEVENCTFASSKPDTDKAAIQMHTEYGINGTVNIKNSTATGFADVNGGLWNELNNNTKVPTNNFEVYVELADGVKQVNGVYEISNAKGMFWFANEVNVGGKTFEGQTLKLVADIDLENQLWEPIGQTGQPGQFQGTFDGNDKTIKNLRIDKTSKNSTHMAAGLFGWVEWSSVCIKNLTIDGATVKAHHYAGAVVGYNSAPVENCTVKNANISCVYNTVLKDDGDKAGAIVGYNQGAGKIKDCSAENCQIDAVRDAGQLVGAAKTADVSGTATNVTVSHNDSAAGYGESSDGTNINETLVGRSL